MINVCSCCKFNTLNWYCITLKAYFSSLFSTFSTVSCYYFAICQTLYATFTALPRAAIIIKFMRYFPTLSMPSNTKNQCWRFMFSTTIILLLHKHIKCSFLPTFFLKFSHIPSSQTHNIEMIHLLSTDPSLLLCYTVTSSSSMVSFRWNVNF